MADHIQLDGRTYVPLSDAASITQLTERQIHAFATDGKVFLRAIGKKIYVDLDGLRAARTKTSAGNAPVPVAAVTPPEYAMQPVITRMPTVPLPVAMPSVVPAPVAPPLVAEPLVAPVIPVTQIQPDAPVAPISQEPTHMPASSAELAALSSPFVAPQDEPLRKAPSPAAVPLSEVAPAAVVMMSQRGAESLSGQDELPRMLLPPKPLVRASIPSNSMQALAPVGVAALALILMLGLGSATYFGAPKMARLVSAASSQLAAVFGQEMTYTSGAYESTPHTAGNQPLLNSSSELQARGVADSMSSTGTSSMPIYYVYNYPVIERVREEVRTIQVPDNQSYQEALDALYKRIQDEIRNLNVNTNTQFAQQYQVIAHTNRIDQLDSVQIVDSIFRGGTIRGARLEDVSIGANNITGVLSVASGGTGTSTAPVYGQLLLGNADGGYSLVATSTLGFGSSVSTSASNSWSALQIFVVASTSQLSVFDKAYFGGTSTTTIDSTGAITVTSNGFNTFPYASTTAFTVAQDAFLNRLALSGAITSTATTANTFLYASTTALSAANGYFGTASSSALTISNIQNGLLSTNASGQVVATTSVGAGYITGSLGTVNGTAFNRGDSITVSAASSTLLSDRNNWTGLNIFANATTTLLSGSTAWFTTFLGNLTGNVTGNASTATALQTARTINGTSFDGTQNITITAASSTLLTDNNVFSGRNTITFASSTALSAISSYFGSASTSALSISNIQNGLLSTNASGQVVATSTPTALSFVATSNIASRFPYASSTALSATSLYSTNAALAYASSTALTVSGTAYFPGSGIWNASGNVGIGTTTPASKLSVLDVLDVHATTGGAMRLVSSSGVNYIQSGLNFTGSSAAPLVFGSMFAGNEWMRITSTGNVGIGTTTPAGKLDVHGGALFVSHNSGFASMEMYGTSGAYIDFKNAYGDDYDARILTTGSGLNFSTGAADALVITSGGNVGVGTTTPFRKLSVANAVAAAQLAVSYDTTRNTDFQTDSSGDLVIAPSGKDVRLNDDNLWVCAGGACPAGAPSGTGNLIVETRLGIGTSTPDSALTVSGGVNAVTVEGTSEPGIRLRNYGYDTWDIFSGGGGSATYNNTLTFFRRSGSGNVVFQHGNVGIGTSTPTDMLSVQGLLRVGANNNAPVTLGTATSTFNGDIRILGKLDVGTIDPIYRIDGIKYATYGHSTIGVKEEVVFKLRMTQWDGESGLYRYDIKFNSLERGSDLWLFYQVTDLGKDWDNLVVSLTPAFKGVVFYKEDPAAGTLTIFASEAGDISARLIGNRFDFSKWGNLRPDQDDDFTHFELPEKK